MQKPTKIYVDNVAEELRRLDLWFKGFEAAGGKIPQCLQGLNALHKARRLLKDNVKVIE